MDTAPTPETPPENNAPPAAQLMAPREEVAAAILPKETERKGKERTQFKPGGPPGPGRPKGRKDDNTIIMEAERALLRDVLTAVPPRNYKRWLKNYAQRHPKEALKIATDLIAKRDAGKGDTHLHFNLAELVSRANKKQDAEKNG